ncbi:hypothetical protein [Cellulomonas olei]|uniref:hypothetical protein n=1 Tax=Cellulomonas sp. P4 TaxID=3142533 RepID=UPI0031B9E829
MSTTRLGRQIAEDTRYLIDAWRPLVELGVPGTSPRRLAAPAPLDLLDLLARFVSVCAEVAETVAQIAGVERLDASASLHVDPRPYLSHARTWLKVAQDANDTTEAWVAEQLHRLADAVAAHLGELADGQVLEALCPWCHGRSERRPTGGDLTLTVYARGPRPGSGGEALRDPMVVCRGTNCEPPPNECGHTVGGHPAWPDREWDWLAARLLPVDTAAPAPATAGAPS